MREIILIDIKINDLHTGLLSIVIIFRVWYTSITITMKIIIFYDGSQMKSIPRPRYFHL